MVVVLLGLIGLITILKSALRGGLSKCTQTKDKETSKLILTMMKSSTSWPCACCAAGYSVATELKKGV